MSYNYTDWSQRGITLSNTLHSEVAPCLPLPSLPPFCGASDEQLRLFDDRVSRPLNRQDVLAQAPKIADLLLTTDVSYLYVLSFLFDLKLCLGCFFSRLVFQFLV